MSDDERRAPGTADESTSDAPDSNDSPAPGPSWDSLWDDSPKTAPSGDASPLDSLDPVSDAPVAFPDTFEDPLSGERPSLRTRAQRSKPGPAVDETAATDARRAKPDSEGEEPAESSEIPLTTTVALGVGLFAVIVLGGLFFRLPVIERKAATVVYSPAALMDTALSEHMADSARREIENKYSIDVSVIFRPPEAETTPGMRSLAMQCMPRRKYKAYTMPQTAHQTFAAATEYLACLMRRDQERLCKPEERARLVAQLMQYRDLREHVFGIERARTASVERITSGPLGKFDAEASELDMKRRGEAGGPSPMNPKIGKRLDQRIASSLVELNRKGYLSISDFTWAGIFAPAEYAPFLDRDEAGVEGPSCG